jgi:hypothetical protein
MIARVRGNGDVATRYKVINGIDINKQYSGVSEGKRGGLTTDQLVSKIAEYKGIGLESDVTFEAEYASVGFDDVRARSVEGLLRAVMINEELLILGGNGSLALGTTPTPSVTAAGTGGTLGAATYSVICVALTLDGYYRASVTSGIQASVTRTNADGSTDTFGGGSAQKSAAASAVIASGTTNSIQSLCNCCSRRICGMPGSGVRQVLKY